MRPLRWYHSFAFRSFAIAFFATHVPLLGLIAWVAWEPGRLSPVGVLAVALVATLVAAVLVIAVLWRLLRPLRLAADGLRDFMRQGQPLRMTPQSGDEVGRLVQMLVMALAHVDRARAPLLHAGALVLERKAATGAGLTGGQTLVLVEVDQWQALDEQARLERMQEVQIALHETISARLRAREIMLPWGRGRFLVVMDGVGADVAERLQPLCDGFVAGASAERLTCSAAMESRAAHSGAWPAALQRLDYRLFALRLDGGAARIT